MNYTIRIIISALLCTGIFSASANDAFASTTARRHSSQSSASQHSSSNNGRRQNARPGNNSNHTSARPGANNRPDRPGSGIRPNRPGHNSGRPDANIRPDRPNRPDRPGHGIQPDRPGHNGGRPGANIRPGRPNRPDRPGSVSPSHPTRPHRPARPQRPPHAGLPPRPHMPPMRPIHHPVPPPSWRPAGRYPVLSTVLGISFGSAIGISVNALVANGYNVSGYGNDMVYLTNVPQLNLNWPDATLYYGPGGLASSQFVYSTPYSDMTRFNIAYNRLVNLYGMPVDYATASGQLSATWFGRNGQFVSLSFAPQYTSNGNLGYYTTLSFGN